jgi:hypothetical protein
MSAAGSPAGRPGGRPSAWVSLGLWIRRMNRASPPLPGTSGSADRGWCCGRCGRMRSMPNGGPWWPPIPWPWPSSPMRPASGPGFSGRVSSRMAGSIWPSMWEACRSGASRHLCPRAVRSRQGHLRWGSTSGKAPVARATGVKRSCCLAEGWLPLSGLALDVGCGLGTEAAHLHRLGWRVIGVDLSPVALAGATRRNHGPGYLQADLLRLPLRSSAFDACLDRGCFHYLPARYRPGYAAELRRVLRPGGKLLLRASVILTTFAEWRVEHMQRTKIPSDTRSLDVLLVRLAA